MKNILSLLLIIGCIICTVSCKNKNAETSDNQNETIKAVKTIVDRKSTTTDSDSLLAIIKNMSKVKPHQIAELKQDAEVIIKHRYKETEKKSYIILDKDLWEYEFIFNGKKMSAVDQFDGYWIDFDQDQTYTYGHYQEEDGGGRYTYNLSTGLLLLIDDSEHIKPQEFDAKLFDITLVLVGSPIYFDNNYNSKLKRITERPKKQN